MRLRGWISLGLALAGLLLAVAPGLATGQSDSTSVPSIELTGSIDPATERWIGSALDQAADDDAPLAIIRIDTPGGLEDSMRAIVKDIIDAPMPVVVYVYPNGARAASAGAFITEAADVAAMAPQTNIGSASAVTSTGGDIGGTLGEKIENDAAAFIRALAQSHGRNGTVPGQMVTEAANVTATEALDAHAIDLIASDQTDLLGQLNGFEVKGPKATTLDTTGLQIDERDMPLSYQLLELIVNPTIAYLLLLIGLIGIVIEIISPGLIFPGLIGLVSLLLGAYGSAQLPVTAIGVALLVIGVALLVAEAHLPTHGLLGVVGVIALVVAGLLLFNTDTSAFEISVPVVIVVAVILGAGLAFAAKKAVDARAAPVQTGVEELVGSQGRVRVPLTPVGQIFVDGALWRAKLAEDAGADEAALVREHGARVRVEAVEGLTLRVRPLTEARATEQGAAT